MKSKLRTLPVLLVLSLAGCAIGPAPNPVTEEVYANRLMAEKMAIAADAQREHAALVAEGQSRIERKQEMLELDLISIDYIGMPQELLQTIAYRYGYRFVEIGRRQQLRSINIKVEQTSPVDVLRTIGQQVDRNANVVLSLTTRTIRLEYKTPVVGGKKKG